MTTIDRTSPNPFLAGNLAPVHEEVTVTNLRVTGTIPHELTGRYLRNGPNPAGSVNEAKYHWFTGHGMVHGIRLDSGNATWYRNRWVRTKEVCDLKGGTPPPSDWPADHPSFPANTNVIGHAGRTFAIVEAGSPPVELSYDLDTIRVSNLDGTLPFAFSAHPKRDPRTGELHVMTYYWGWGNQVQYLVVGVDGRVRRHVDIPLPGGPMIHDLAITERYVLIFDLPCVFNLDAAMKGARLPYFWEPAYEPLIGFLPREGSAHDVKWVTIDPCYIFHPMNAFDDGDEVVLDAARHPRMFDREQRGPSEGDPVLTRWRLNPHAGTSRENVISDRPQEFPRIRESLIGQRYRFGYCAGIGAGFAQDTLTKVDHDAGTVVARSDQPRYGYGEPVFVPRQSSFESHNGSTGSGYEDDGYLIALRHDTETDTSDLAIFDAQAITDDPVAVVHLPVRVPNGFHGNWIPDATLDA
ncbi:MAG: carotenoid oxygenase family protein [Ilumatobacteraceae bacterium]